MTGIQLVFLGLIGEYVGRIYEQVKLRPMYVVDQILTADNTKIDSLAPERNNPIHTKNQDKIQPAVVDPANSVFPSVDLIPDVSSEFPIG